MIEKKILQSMLLKGESGKIEGGQAASLESPSEASLPVPQLAWPWPLAASTL